MKGTIAIFLLGLLAMGLLVVGCVAGPTPEPQGPAEIAMTMAAQKMDAEATQMRIDIQYTATAQVVEATRIVEHTQVAAAATEQARQDVMATDQQFRKDAAATEQSRRRDAAATEQRIRDDEATQQARRDIEATADQGRRDASGTATAQQVAIWNAATLQVAPTHDAMTLQAAYVEQTLAANDAELSNLNVEQQGQKNTVEWVIPLGAVMIIVIVWAVVQFRKSRVQKIVNEEDGTVEGLLVDEQLLRPQLMLGPVLDLRGKTATAPEVTDKETQREVTRRAQAVEALRAMPTQNPTANAAGMMNSVFSQEQRAPAVEVLMPGQQGTRVILDELSDQVIEEE